LPFELVNHAGYAAGTTVVTGDKSCCSTIDFSIFCSYISSLPR